MRLLCLFPLILLLSCNSGRKALQRGDYQEAVLTAIERLRQSPSNRKAQQTLAEAYPRFLDYNQDRISQTLGSRDPLRWEQVLDYYRQINDVYDEIKRSPAASGVISNPRLFTAEYERAREQVVLARYELGQAALAAARPGDREAAKQAFDHFDRVAGLNPGFRDVAALRDEARQLATLRVLVEPIPVPSRTLQVSGEFFYNQLMEYLQTGGISPFIEFYSVQEAASRDLQPDQRISLAFDDFVVGQAMIRETIKERARDSVVIGQTEVIENGEKVTKDVYGTVKATVHFFEKQIDSRGILDARVIAEATGAVLAQEKFPGSFTWIDYWGFYNGDERALTDDDRRKLRNRYEVMPPPPQDLFVEFTKPIFRDLSRFLSDFYRNY